MTLQTLSLSSIEPVTIADNREEITFRLEDGRSLTQKIAPTPKAKLDKLAEALASLLSPPASTSAWSSTLLVRSDSPSFGTLQWDLDPQGDAIHRHVALSSPGECDKLVQRIIAVADEMNHHPHIAREEGGSCLTITCTTHRPRGLSVRDTRLATRVNELLAGIRVTQPAQLTAPSRDLEQLQKQIFGQHARMIAINRQQITEALESCNCGPARA
ncbi:hypothetical protein A1O3_01362 [Capronia epimyces CBS 606.96]|uniref:4a-hydroxytetrahydrobiopterin dehydratase n=1 Tax=Capronia epimyces CBS 606.96 TaxID=1182542 RepID=W9YJS8_9EURO|nr:uncharacterized protein A1O3_01362 [Capronia epimyces CBS 606.96]EXJ92808.1 hypothetical protein A1O3_01362 [Capronia epimyces CBS 606.96]